MLAAWYEQNGPAADVMKVGELPDPTPAAGEVRVRLSTSAVNPSDVKARNGSRKIMWPKLIPNSDGAGVIDQVGAGVDAARIGQRVWTFNGQCNALMAPARNTSRYRLRWPCRCQTTSRSNKAPASASR